MPYRRLLVNSNARTYEYYELIEASIKEGKIDIAVNLPFLPRFTFYNVRYRTSERVLCLSKLLFTMRLALIHP
jgi:hypothetical protein